MVLSLGFSVIACQAESTLDEIRAMQTAGRYGATLWPLRERIDAGDQSGEILVLYGRALSATGEKDAAMWPLRRAMQDPDWRVPAGLQLARDAFDTGNNDAAIDTSSRVLEIEPDNVFALVLRSRARLETRRQLEGALEDADRALELDPDSVAARKARVVTLLAMEKIEEAAEALEAIEALAYEVDPDQPDSARYCGARATFAKESGDPDLAAERYADCLEKYPGSSLLVTEAVRFYKSRGESERAVEILRAALVEAPGNRDFRIGLALHQVALGRLDEAEATMREGTTDSSHPGRVARAWLDLAGFLIDIDRVDAGIEAMQKGMENLAEIPNEVRFRFADSLVIADRLDEALEAAEAMSIEAHRDLVRGRVALARGDSAAALEAFDAGLREWPENAVARYYAAIAAEGLGDYDRAVEEFRYSIRAGAAETDARLRLAKLHNAEGLYDDAVAVLRHDLSNNTPTPEMAALEINILSRVAGQKAVPPHLSPVINRDDVWQHCISALAHGLEAHAGPEAAIAFFDEIRVDFLNPVNGPLLRDQVEFYAQAEKPELGMALAEKSVAAHPDAAGFHVALGTAHLLGAADTAAAKSAFERARELAPDQSDALAGLAHLAQLSGDAALAIDLYLEADAAKPEDPAALEAAIDLMISADRHGEAEQQLERLLEREPYLGAAALRLVELRVARGAAQEERTRVLARLAMRFGGVGPAAQKVLASAGRS